MIQASALRLVRLMPVERIDVPAFVGIKRYCDKILTLFTRYYQADCTQYLFWIHQLQLMAAATALCL